MRDKLPQRRGEHLLVPCIQGLNVHEVAANFKESTTDKRGPCRGSKVVRADVYEGQEQEEAVDDLCERCQCSARGRRVRVTHPHRRSEDEDDSYPEGKVPSEVDLDLVLGMSNTLLEQRNTIAQGPFPARPSFGPLGGCDADGTSRVAMFS